MNTLIWSDQSFSKSKIHISGSNLLNTHFLTNNAQQLLSTIQPPNLLPSLAAAAAAQQQAVHKQQQQQSQQQQTPQCKSSLQPTKSHHISSRHSPLAINNHLKSSRENLGTRPKSHSPTSANLSNHLMFEKCIREMGGSSGGAARLTPIPERTSDPIDRANDEHRKNSPNHNSSRDSQSPNYPNRYILIIIPCIF